jgi:NAD(P)H-quinone oxidoreductase subunit 4
VFYGAENSELMKHVTLTDSKPREAFIALCLIVPIIGIGIYPKLATQTYDAKTSAIAIEARQVLPVLAAQPMDQFKPAVIASPAIESTQELAILVK